MGPVKPDDEERHEDRDCQRHDVGRSSGVDDLHSLDRAENGNRRRNHAVAVEQGGAEDSPAQSGWAGPPQASATRHVRLSAPVRARSTRGCRLRPGYPRASRWRRADGDNQHQCVDDQRQDAEDVLVRRRNGMRAEEALAHRVHAGLCRCPRTTPSAVTSGTGVARAGRISRDRRIYRNGAIGQEGPPIADERVLTGSRLESSTGVEAGCAPGGSAFTNLRRIPVSLESELGNSSIMRAWFTNHGPAGPCMNFLRLSYPEEPAVHASS